MKILFIFHPDRSNLFTLKKVTNDIVAVVIYFGLRSFSAYVKKALYIKTCRMIPLQKTYDKPNEVENFLI